MSLVNEALKKARMEAAREDAAKSGIPYPALGRGQRASSGPWTPILAAVLLLLVGLGGIFLYRAGRQSVLTPTSAEPREVAEAASERPSVDPVAATTSSADGPAGAQLGPTVEKPEDRPLSPPQPPSANVVSASPVMATPEPTIVREEPRRRLQADDAEPESRPALERPNRPVQEPGPAPQPTPTPAEPDPSSEPEVALPTAEYLRSAEIAGVGPIELGGIAWSGDRPFALVNGRVVRPGDSVLGLMIEEIQPNTVRLRGDSGDIVLKLK